MATKRELKIQGKLKRSAWAKGLQNECLVWFGNFAGFVSCHHTGTERLCGGKYGDRAEQLLEEE
jgi:hypothetical protein